MQKTQKRKRIICIMYKKRQTNCFQKICRSNLLLYFVKNSKILPLIPGHLRPICLHVILILIDQLRNRHNLIPFLLQTRNHCLQCVSRILGAIVHQDNSAVIQFIRLHHTSHYVIGSIILPVQRILSRYICKVK